MTNTNYGIGTEEVLLRLEITNKETGKVSNMFFDSYAQQEEIIRLLSATGNYTICLYGGYDMKVIGC
jgi:hypothetical protein